MTSDCKEPDTEPDMLMRILEQVMASRKHLDTITIQLHDLSVRVTRIEQELGGVINEMRAYSVRLGLLENRALQQSLKMCDDKNDD